ncbi:MAG: helix-turn-helix domain-containing protein [Magnetococcales bacterium]|nr:helix-turn-helix domain-containing protein [Magnetococcales bacterium]
MFIVLADQNITNASMQKVKRQPDATPFSCRTGEPCAQCALSGFVRLLSEIPLELAQLFLFTKRSIARGETLFRVGDPFAGVYALREGGIKSFVLTSQSEERVLGFTLPGELLGMESIQTAYYQSTAVALEPGEVCCLPLTQLYLLGERFPRFQEQLIQILVNHLSQQRQQFVLSARQSAEERLAAFLLNIGERHVQHGFVGHTFRLGMLRLDIANFLGLSMETVSRTLKQFQARSLLHVTGKQIRLLDIPTLQAIAQYTFSQEIQPG